MVGARRIRTEKLREHQYKEGILGLLKGKKEHMWVKVKRVMAENAREACGSVKVGENSKEYVVER